VMDSFVVLMAEAEGLSVQTTNSRMETC